MPKYYIHSGNATRIAVDMNAVQAAANAVYTWKMTGEKIGKSIRVSEVGFDFDGDHPHHKLDCIFSANYVRALLK